jgi:hypothetical protein
MYPTTSVFSVVHTSIRSEETKGSIWIRVEISTVLLSILSYFEIHSRAKCSQEKSA